MIYWYEIPYNCLFKVVWYKMSDDVPYTIGTNSFRKDETRISVKNEVIDEEEDVRAISFFNY